MEQEWQVKAEPHLDPDAFEREVRRKAAFLVATNLLDAATLPDLSLIRAYKAQSGVERGFAFLKDPLFLASTAFVKKPQRIMTLAFVMVLCLLVYQLAEVRVRRRLAATAEAAEAAEAAPDQLRQLTSASSHCGLPAAVYASSGELVFFARLEVPPCAFPVEGFWACVADSSAACAVFAALVEVARLRAVGLVPLAPFAPVVFIVVDVRAVLARGRGVIALAGASGPGSAVALGAASGGAGGSGALSGSIACATGTSAVGGVAATSSGAAFSSAPPRCAARASPGVSRVACGR
jgi:hypothetical protein